MRTDWTQGLCTWLVLAGIALPALGWTQTSAVPDSCDAHPDCAARADQARKQAADGAYDAAFTSYQAAYSLRQSPKLLFNMARMLHKAGHLSRAADYYSHYITDGKTEPSEQLAKAASYLKAIEQELELAISASSRPQGAVSTTQTSGNTLIRPDGTSLRLVPVWRISAGVVVAAVGLTLFGIGISGVVLQGKCRQWTEAAWQSPVCVEQYETLAPAGVLLGTGLGVAISGALLAAIPQRKRRESLSLLLRVSEPTSGFVNFPTK